MTATRPQNQTPRTTRMVTQDQFAQKIRCAMNESAEQLPESINEKLRASRRLALNARKQSREQNTFSWLAPITQALSGLGASLALAAPAVILSVGLYVMSHSNADSYVQSVAEIDTQVLSQELPIDALLDKGFARYVQVGE